MLIDFHSPANTPEFGYGRAYFGLRNELEKAVASEGRHRLAKFYTGGDVQIYCGGLYGDLEPHFQRKSLILLAYTMYEATILHPDF